MGKASSPRNLSEKILCFLLWWDMFFTIEDENTLKGIVADKPIEISEWFSIVANGGEILTFGEGEQEGMTLFQYLHFMTLFSLGNNFPESRVRGGVS
jgi:hypothetical protein